MFGCMFGEGNVLLTDLKYDILKKQKSLVHLRKFFIATDKEKGNNDGLFNKAEMTAGLKGFGIAVDSYKSAIDDLYDELDKDKNGTIDIKEFLVGLWETGFTPARKMLVDAAWGTADKDGSGTLTYDEVKERYDGKLTSFDDWCKSFNPEHAGGADFLTKDEFYDFYAGESAKTEDSAAFSAAVKTAWKLY